MPELSRFYGIIIKMYFNDTQQHHKPHIHAFHEEEVYKAWNNAVRGEHFDKINPL